MQMCRAHDGQAMIQKNTGKGDSKMRQIESML